MKIMMIRRQDHAERNIVPWSSPVENAPFPKRHKARQKAKSDGATPSTNRAKVEMHQVQPSSLSEAKPGSS